MIVLTDTAQSTQDEERDFGVDEAKTDREDTQTSHTSNERVFCDPP